MVKTLPDSKADRIWSLVSPERLMPLEASSDFKDAKSVAPWIRLSFKRALKSSS